MSKLLNKQGEALLAKIYPIIRIVAMRHWPKTLPPNATVPRYCLGHYHPESHWLRSICGEYHIWTGRECAILRSISHSICNFRPLTLYLCDLIIIVKYVKMMTPLSVPATNNRMCQIISPPQEIFGSSNTTEHYISNML